MQRLDIMACNTANKQHMNTEGQAYSTQHIYQKET